MPSQVAQHSDQPQALREARVLGCTTAADAGAHGSGRGVRHALGSQPLGWALGAGGERCRCVYSPHSSDSCMLIHYAALNPDPLDLPLLDDKDRELLWEPPGGPNRAAEAAVPTNVTWLRKKESIARQSAMTAQKPCVSIPNAFSTPYSILHILTEPRNAPSPLQSSTSRARRSYATSRRLSRLRMRTLCWRRSSIRRRRV